MESKWNFESVIVGGNIYKINGYNIWDYEWTYIPNTIKVLDPNYNEEFDLDIVEFKVKENKVQFGIVEFSNNVFGIFKEIM